MRIYIIAGEPSGDLLAAGLMKALLRTGRDVEFRGIGGAEMLGVQRVTDEMSTNALTESRFDISEISVMGFFEVLPRLPLILKRIRQTAVDIETWRPDVLVTVDSWGFVSAVLGRLRGRGTAPKTVHYVAPQVWAWKKGRARSVARLVDRLMTLLPDEGRYFEKYGLQCDFVGHPVVERVAEWRTSERAGVDFRAELRAEMGVPEGARVVSVLPGSRRSETKRLEPIFDEAVGLLRERFPELYVVAPSSSDSLEFRLNCFAVSEIAIAKSGTVSLELAAVGVPHLIAYTFSRLTNFLAKRLVTVRFANLINLLADREIVPEFVLENCRPQKIAACAEELLDDPAKAQKQVAEAQKILKKMQLPGVRPSDAAAKVILQVVESN